SRTVPRNAPDRASSRDLRQSDCHCQAHRIAVYSLVTTIAMPLPLAALGPAAAALSYIDARLDLSNDYRILNALIRSKANALILERKKRVSPFYLLEEAATSPASKDRIFLIYQGNSWTYAEAYQIVLKYGTWFKERFNIKKGDIVAMNFMNSNVFI